MVSLAPQILTPPVSRRGIYWLASYPKSGNTWMRIFIGHLLGLIQNDPDVENTRLMLEKYTTIETAKVNYAGLMRDTAMADPLEVFRTRPHAQQLLATRFAHSGFVKTHSAALTSRGIPQINLGVTRGALYIVRNPLDVACSSAPYFGVSLDDAIERMNLPAMHIPGDEKQLAEILSSWSAHVQSWVESVNPLVVRYEDLVDKPVETFAAFVKHAGVRATPAQIERARELSSFSRLKEIESSEGFYPQITSKGRTFFRVGKSEQWRDMLSPKQVERIVNDHGKWMQRFGYLP